MNGYTPRMSNSDIEEAVRAILKACATAPRDFAATKVIEAFNRFAVGAQAAKKPLSITIRLTPGAKALADSTHP